MTDIPNLVIISPSPHKNDTKTAVNDTSFDLITSRFVSEENNNDSLILDTFDVLSGSFDKNADLFPNKFMNLEGRIVRVALFNYKPYAIWEEVVIT